MDQRCLQGNCPAHTTVAKFQASGTRNPRDEPSAFSKKAQDQAPDKPKPSHSSPSSHSYSSRSQNAETVGSTVIMCLHFSRICYQHGILPLHRLLLMSGTPTPGVIRLNSWRTRPNARPPMPKCPTPNARPPTLKCLMPDARKLSEDRA